MSRASPIQLRFIIFDEIGEDKKVKHIKEQIPAGTHTWGKRAYPWLWGQSNLRKCSRQDNSCSVVEQLHTITDSKKENQISIGK